ncbi:hypothetical protein RDABS01_029979 [Bienertia sinuspersici]
MVSLKWLTRALIEVEKVSMNVFIFYCQNGEDRDKLVALSTACYKGALIVFKRWIPNSSLADYNFSLATLWVGVEGLPLHINQVHVASKLLERFGSVVYFDGKVRTEGPQKAVRARFNMQLRGALIPGCYLELEQGKTKWVDFRYEGVYVVCMHCGRVGHKDSHCKRSPRRAKEDILRAMNKLCTEKNDTIINEDSGLPVYSRKICGLKATPENKTTSINLLLMTHTFRPEDSLDSSETEGEDKDDDDGDGDDPWPDYPGDSEDDPDEGSGSSKKRPPSHSGSNSSDPEMSLGNRQRRQGGTCMRD